MVRQQKITRLVTRSLMLLALWVAIGVIPAWAAPVLSRIEPDRAVAPARGLLVKLHGSGFEIGDQVELMRADVPALVGRTARIRGAMGGDSGGDRHEVVLPDEWTHDPGELQMRVVSSRRETSAWVVLRLVALLLTPGRAIPDLPRQLMATPDAVTVPCDRLSFLPVTLHGGLFVAGMTYEVKIRFPTTGYIYTNPSRPSLEVTSPTAARIMVDGCYLLSGESEYRLYDASGRRLTDWIRIPWRR